MIFLRNTRGKNALEIAVDNGHFDIGGLMQSVATEIYDDQYLLNDKNIDSEKKEKKGLNKGREEEKGRRVVEGSEGRVGEGIVEERNHVISENKNDTKNNKNDDKTIQTSDKISNHNNNNSNSNSNDNNNNNSNDNNSNDNSVRSASSSSSKRNVRKFTKDKIECSSSPSGKNSTDNVSVYKSSTVSEIDGYGRDNVKYYQKIFDNNNTENKRYISTKKDNGGDENKVMKDGEESKKEKEIEHEIKNKKNDINDNRIIDVDDNIMNTTTMNVRSMITACSKRKESSKESSLKNPKKEHSSSTYTHKNENIMDKKLKNKNKNTNKNDNDKYTNNDDDNDSEKEEEEEEEGGFCYDDNADSEEYSFALAPKASQALGYYGVQKGGDSGEDCDGEGENEENKVDGKKGEGGGGKEEDEKGDGGGDEGKEGRRGQEEER